jgi:hypothetical protein
MAAEPPPNEMLAQNHTTILWDIFEKVFLGIYTCEMLIKISAFGFISKEKTYMRDPWNVMDLLIVLSSWVTLFFKDGSISMIRTVRLLRTLRTLRTIQAFDDLQNLVSILL